METGELKMARIWKEAGLYGVRRRMMGKREKNNRKKNKVM